MNRLWSIVAAAAVIVTGCQVASEAGVAPTPQIIYVTPEPQVAPTPQIIYVTPEPQVAPTPAPPSDAPITVKGTGTKNTAPFELAGGDYVISWTIEATSASGCYHSASLESPTDRLAREDAGSALLKDKGSLTDTTHVYGLDPGRYYFAVISGCDWTIGIAR